MKIYGDYTSSVIRAFNETDPQWMSYDGLVVCGSHNPKNWETIIKEIHKAYSSGRPFYGECWGHQLAAIAYARYIKGIEDATSEEWGQGTFVVKKRKEGLNVGLKDGESYWNNYEVVIDTDYPENFFTAQYHASYQSKKGKPHPLIKSFLEYAKKEKR